MDSNLPPIRKRAAQLFQSIQTHICSKLESIDGAAKFATDYWQRPDIRGGDGGGGATRILANGDVFEKAGVNFSEVLGHVSADFAEKLGAPMEELPFFATGVSLVIHPRSPMVPTTHANWRYLELGDKAWFGGGSDLTPYYLEDADATHFHSVLKDVCERHSPEYYTRFKKWCDEYFYLPHRRETRGIGGIFFDHLGRNDGANHEQLLTFVRDLGFAFTEQYIPIVERRMRVPYGEHERYFQLLRRGRYVEFNLLYDRGTHFGLQTGGRTESILMSLPPEVRWDYCPSVTPGSREEYLLHTLQKPRDWV
ncbi:MAG: oxygen-dependent coproporphyrinogen oxidase [Pseudomonadota bacterium]|jgi:coproporphyrinogen III oxidase